MPRNVLLTSLSAVENILPERHFAVRDKDGIVYCDALLDAEAGIKAVLARYQIDEIDILGDANTCDKEDEMKAVSLSHENVRYSGDGAPLSTYDLLLSRIVRYADGLTDDPKADEEYMPAEMQQKLIRYIQDFQSADAELKALAPDQLFDAIAQNDQAYERFCTMLDEACPECGDLSGVCIHWMTCHLYEALTPSAKMKILPANKATTIRLIPTDMVEGGEQWVDRMLAAQKSVVEDGEDINLYISLNGESAASSFFIMNLLDILVSMPGSGVHLKRAFTVNRPQGHMAGIVRDDTGGFGVTELMHATRSFLNYGKADMIVAIWEKSGKLKGSIADMVYAMRHVDVGLSMCNMPEMEQGILRLRQLFRDEKLLREFGYYGLLFSVIVKSIQEDYGTLLEGDGDIPFIDLVKWAYRHQFYQQTLTLIESKTPENLVKTGMFYYCNDERDAKHVTQLFAEQRLRMRPHEYYLMNSLEHYFIKNYDRGRVKHMSARGQDPQRVYATLKMQSIDNQDPSYITGYTACDNRETLQELLYAYYRIGFVRNMISHAHVEVMRDRGASDRNEISALTWMTKSIDAFIENYEKAMAEVCGKTPNVVLIDSAEVREVAEQMAFERRREN